MSNDTRKMKVWFCIWWHFQIARNNRLKCQVSNTEHDVNLYLLWSKIKSQINRAQNIYIIVKDMNTLALKQTEFVINSRSTTELQSRLGQHHPAAFNFWLKGITTVNTGFLHIFRHNINNNDGSDFQMAKYLEKISTSRFLWQHAIDIQNLSKNIWKLNLLLDRMHKTNVLVAEYSR